MIQVFNIVSGKYNTHPTVCLMFLTLEAIYINCSCIITYVNSNIIVAVWNSLPNIVVSTDTTNIFKNCLDKFWINQEFKFDFYADIAGIGRRSIISLSYV